MLRLKRLELLGFKSFADRTEMRFPGTGITAVVGPNGCGKSNLADAISWVLGEQSAKSLRGTRMEDVIFAGSRERKPLGMAAVTITFVDPEGELEIEEIEAATPGNGDGSASHPTKVRQGAREITITRRLFRSGESEYLIDGRPARLRDIQDIFLGTGLGPGSYAIIEQGRVAQILSTRPQDRRALIEEAAGISKFKTKRRLAEAKLESARHNLSRVFDILEEVGRQLNSLKRQASKAQRYQALREEWAREFRKALTGRYRILEQEITKATLELNLLTSEVRRLREEIQQQEESAHGLQAQAQALETELGEARSRLSEARVEAEGIRQRIQGQGRQVAEIDQRLALDQAEIEHLNRREQELVAELGTQDALLERLARQLDDERHGADVKARERDRIQSELRQAQREIEEARQSLLRLLGETANLRNELVQSDEFLASLDREAERARRELELAENERQQLASEVVEATAAAQRLRASLVEIGTARQTLESELAARKQVLAETRQAVEKLRDEVSRLEARRQSLEQILAHRAYTPDTIQKLFALSGSRGGFELLGVVADFLEVEAGWERAVEQFLQEELHYVLVPRWTDAEQALLALQGQLEGRCTFLVAESQRNPAPRSALPFGPETGVVARLADVVQTTGPLDRRWLEDLPRFANCYLVQDPAKARQLASGYPAAYFLLPDGRWYSGFTVTGGRRDTTGPLALKRELRELVKVSRACGQQLEEAAARVRALEQEIEQLAAQLDGVRSDQVAREKELTALEQRLRQLEQELGRANTKIAVNRRELNRIEIEARRVAERKTAIGEQLQVSEQERQQVEQEIARRQAQAEALARELEKLSEEYSALRVGVAELEERRKAAERHRSQLQSQRSEVEGRKRRLQQEMERLAAEKARLGESNSQLEQRAAQLAVEMEQLSRRLAELEAQADQLRQAYEQAEENRKRTQQALEQARDRRSQIEVWLAERKAELRYLEQTAQQELSLELSAVAQEEQGVEVDELAVAEAEEKARELRTRMDALGPVNPQAWEEYQEVQQRYDFLNAQRQDLLDSIRDTEKAIREMDQESRRRFKEAFEAINTNFQRLFRTLFGGGSAEMRLTDPEDPSESGIEIVASPPGKRLQNVLLLSGGEKALTALALLMAIFEYQPSPFCLLDEVDAPLDEANIERLLRLLKEMSQKTQFILITHAKRTMEAAEALYGVTMEEPGVSKLVSVRLTEPERDAAGAPASEVARAAS